VAKEGPQMLIWTTFHICIVFYNRDVLLRICEFAKFTRSSNAQTPTSTSM
jgi:hypothetical protein